MTARASVEIVEQRRLVEVAVRYAAHGWPVLPLHTPEPRRGCSCRGASSCTSPGKHPRTRNGVHDASTDPDQVRNWWTQWPSANVGVATGSASGLLVLDVDLPHGPTSLEDLEASYSRLPATCEQRTGSGGRQLLVTSGGDSTMLGNRTAIRPGIDVRGEGGYIVVPPSRHHSGSRYCWTQRMSPVHAPEWLVALLDRDRSAKVAASARTRSLPIGSSGYASAALERELEVLAGAVEGTRNGTLNRAAFNLGQLVGAGALSADEVSDRLEAIATDIGLSQIESRRTIASGMTAGMARPRVIPRPEGEGLAMAPRQRVRRRR